MSIGTTAASNVAVPDACSTVMTTLLFSWVHVPDIVPDVSGELVVAGTVSCADQFPLDAKLRVPVTGKPNEPARVEVSWIGISAIVAALHVQVPSRVLGAAALPSSSLPQPATKTATLAATPRVIRTFSFDIRILYLLFLNQSPTCISTTSHMFY